jgi:hypothetical protein
MSKELAVMHYKTAITVFKSWLDTGVITEDDFALIDDLIAQKYGLPNGSIYR